MATATITAVTVLSTDEGGVYVEVDGERRHPSWGQILAAAQQDDADLARAYQQILREASAIAADGPVVVAVGRDSSNVWWVATVRALHGGGEANYRRRADEGGTHGGQLTASCEAEDICRRLGSRVARREGFDGPAAKARVAAIMAH